MRKVGMPGETFAGSIFEGTEVGTVFSSKYRVFKLDESLQETENIKYGYRVVGPRAEWLLQRNLYKPQMLFVMGSATTFFASKIRGIEWFRETADGIEPVR